jgi:hypothetical protein
VNDPLFSLQPKQERMFFFEKKNQKTSIPLPAAYRQNEAQTDKSLFASFSSEKEESFLLPP